jgi:hypothetical protein
MSIFKNESDSPVNQTQSHLETWVKRCTVSTKDGEFMRAVSQKTSSASTTLILSLTHYQPSNIKPTTPTMLALSLTPMILLISSVTAFPTAVLPASSTTTDPPIPILETRGECEDNEKLAMENYKATHKWCDVSYWRLFEKECWFYGEPRGCCVDEAKSNPEQCNKFWPGKYVEPTESD